MGTSTMPISRHTSEQSLFQDITANSKPNVKCYTIRVLKLYTLTTGITTAHGFPLYTVHT
jgi:hypothetical protein